MKVKIGNDWYDPNDQPIMIILNEFDKKLINNMSKKNTKYCSYPKFGYSEQDITDFMEIEEEDIIHKEKVPFSVYDDEK